MQQAIINGNIYTEDGILTDSVIIVENSVIQSVQKEVPMGAEIIDLKGSNIAAGLIDIQLNGGSRFHFSQHPAEETIHDLYQSSLQTDTTHLLPCLISSSRENILKAIESIKNYREKYRNGVLGMHLEGPFINPVKRGAHLASQVRKPVNGELEEIIRYGRGIIKIITIAPECFRDDQIEMLVDSGIVVSAGHSAMTYKQSQFYFSKGIKLVTHLFNGMTQFGHREPGLVGATFENEAVYAPIILDGAHCDFAAARIAYKQKKEKLILISDALFLGKKVKHFAWQGFKAELVNGQYRNEEGALAGAAISMADAVRSAVLHLGVPISEAMQMAGCRVAAAIKMENEIGRVKPGFAACFVKFDNDLQNIGSLVL